MNLVEKMNEFVVQFSEDQITFNKKSKEMNQKINDIKVGFNNTLAFYKLNTKYEDTMKKIDKENIHYKASEEKLMD